MATYDRYPVTLVRGKGVRVQDDAGRWYLDMAGGIAAVPIGHAHPRWVAAVTEQAGTLVHVSNLFRTGPQERLAERLVALAGFGEVFLSNSGAEANEAALKIVRKWGRARGKSRVVTLAGSFHGRTFATLAATGRPEKQAPFLPLVEGFSHVPPGDFQALQQAVDRTVAAVMLEPVLGEGGVIPLHPAYLAEARALCDRHDALLVLDEVQTGVGRTGTWFAFQGTQAVRPDVVTLAKGLGGGLPIGATIASPEAAFGAGEHASTFGGGPVPCAGALAVLDVIEEEGLLDNAMTQGKRLRAELREALPEGTFREVRGRGLLVGIELAGRLRSRDVVLALLERGVLSTEAGPSVVRLSPPLSISEEEVAEAIDALAGAVARVAEEGTG
ncbi:MAG: acetylornithine transaminase [Actinobacteria bacterium]|nr:acetylornithine transaminase [Actinomycetota bacterium]